MISISGGRYGTEIVGGLDTVLDESCGGTENPAGYDSCTSATLCNSSAGYCASGCRAEHCTTDRSCITGAGNPATPPATTTTTPPPAATTAVPPTTIGPPTPITTKAAGPMETPGTPDANSGMTPVSAIIAAQQDSQPGRLNAPMCHRVSLRPQHRVVQIRARLRPSENS